MRVTWCLWPFGRNSKRRRERSKRKSTRKGTFPERGERTARTTDGERRHMFDLYEQGLGTHAIAKKTGRSTHTVHSVLTRRGTRPLPERNPEPVDEESDSRTGGGGRRRRRGKRDDAGTTDRGRDMSEALAAKLEPKIIEACAQFIRSDPETLRQVVGSIMGVKIPRRTLDDMSVQCCTLYERLRPHHLGSRQNHVCDGVDPAHPVNYIFSTSRFGSHFEQNKN